MKTKFFQWHETIKEDQDKQFKKINDMEFDLNQIKTKQKTLDV